MDQVVTYRASESSGDPALAPAFGAMFLGSAAVGVLAGLRYRDFLGDLGFAVILGLSVLMGLVALSILFLLRRNVLFAIASPDEGLLVRWGYGGRTRIDWEDIGRVVRTRDTEDSPTATINVLVKPRHRVVFPPGEGQEELYDLFMRVLDGKRPRRKKGRGKRQASPQPTEDETQHEVTADINGVLALLWSLFKLASIIVGGIFVASAVDQDDPLLGALYVAIGFVIVVPLGLFPPSAASSVVRAKAGPAGLSYQGVVLSTRTIPWERLALARLYIPGQAGKLALRYIELFDVDGGRLLVPRPRNPEFYAYLDRRLGTSMTEARPSQS
jgi:hypothetical protein